MQAILRIYEADTSGVPCSQAQSSRTYTVYCEAEGIRLGAKFFKFSDLIGEPKETGGKVEIAWTIWKEGQKEGRVGIVDFNKKSTNPPLCADTVMKCYHEWKESHLADTNNGEVVGDDSTICGSGKNDFQDQTLDRTPLPILSSTRMTEAQPEDSSIQSEATLDDASYFRTADEGVKVLLNPLTLCDVLDCFPLAIVKSALSVIGGECPPIDRTQATSITRIVDGLGFSNLALQVPTLVQKNQGTSRVGKLTHKFATMNISRIGKNDSSNCSALEGRSLEKDTVFPIQCKDDGQRGDKTYTVPNGGKIKDLHKQKQYCDKKSFLDGSRSEDSEDSGDDVSGDGNESSFVSRVGGKGGVDSAYKKDQEGPTFRGDKQFSVEPTTAIMSAAGGEMELTLTNVSKWKAAFKVNTSDVIHYDIEPLEGIIDAGATATLAVTRFSGNPGQAKIQVRFKVVHHRPALAKEEIQGGSVDGVVIVRLKAV